jgi:hypothetical protein
MTAVSECTPSIRREVWILVGGRAILLKTCGASALESAPAFVDGLRVTSIVRLVQWKLESRHLEDNLHLKEMDDVGLIRPEIEAGLSETLRARLAEVRATE